MAADDVSTRDFLAHLRSIVGRRHVLTGSVARPFTSGYRFGAGNAEAVVRPGSLVEMWRAAQACINAGRILIVQAANTGLTGGSTPYGQYDRDVVVLSTTRIKGVFPVRERDEIVCLAGATLDELEQYLAPLGREPHSVIGSSCIGASVIGGICNNSGGALVRRGPAYTEYAVYGRVDDMGQLVLCNRLGIDLGDDPEIILANLEGGRFGEFDTSPNPRAASAAADYQSIVRAVDETSPARFNADPARLFEASGSAGKLIVFAVRLDTFEAPARSLTFYIGTNEPNEFTELRRELLSGGYSLPISAEYIHRDAFDLADRFGKDMILAIRLLGTRRLPFLFSLKERIDRLAHRFPFLPRSLADRLMHFSSKMFGDQLPARMRDFRDRFEHHLILKIEDEGRYDLHDLLDKMFPSRFGDIFECTEKEGELAMLHRFAVAGAAVRYRALHDGQVEDIVALDIALPRNSRDWAEKLPAAIEQQCVGKLYYGHFLCHVFHQDYLVRAGCDAELLEHQLLEFLKAKGAEYPAEHNVGHLYVAQPELAQHYRSLDPTNTCNPGIGKTSRSKSWA
jgi:D-lactate dehydrogenase